jgi:hypothetical protein
MTNEINTLMIVFIMIFPPLFLCFLVYSKKKLFHIVGLYPSPYPLPKGEGILLSTIGVLDG